MVISEKLVQLQELNINEILDECLKEIEDFILELNRDQLYEKGQINVNEPQKREKYSAAYKRFKERKATFKKTEFVTLRFDGEVYDSFKLIIFEKEIIISATDLKWANWLEKNDRFGNALGLTEESKTKLRVELLPLIIEKMRNVI
ncbi:MAG: hypothetical protein WC886_07745 [Saccharofermentanaceae bacterium]|jgi:hypothetical protein